jgi:hypothetical protein
MRKAWLIYPLLCLLAAGVTGAAEPAGVRLLSLGGAGVALPGEAASLYWNPAALYYQDRIAMNITTEYEKLDWPVNWGFTYTNYSRSLKQGAGLGVYRIIQPQGGNATAVMMTTVYPTPLKLPLGMSFKYIRENWSGVGKKNYFSIDLGTMLPLGPFLLGASVQSVTQPQSRLFPYRVLLGASFTLQGWLTLTSQAGVRTWDEARDADLADLRAGIEFAPFTYLSFQGGWRQIPGEMYWTSGVGLSDGRNRHHLNLGYYWHPDRQRSDQDRYFVGYDYML